MNEVVFLTAWAPFDSDRRRLGITALADRFKVTVADLSPLLAPQHAQDEMRPDTVRIKDYSALETFLRGKRSAFFCDYVLGCSPLLPSHARLFRAMAKAGTRYFVVSAAELPAAADNTGGFFRKVLSRLRSNSGLLRYFLALSLKGVIARLRARGVFARPSRVYTVDGASAAGIATACGLGREIIRPVNSLDYSAYLEAKAAGLKTAATGTCVLIEEGLVDSRDFTYAGLKPLSGEEYYPLINAFLTRVAGELGLRPVVAAHPKSDAVALAAKYPGVEIISGRTLESVASSSLVLAHWSTAINFAVICDKPLLLLKSRDMESKGLTRFVENMAQALGAREAFLEDYLERNLDFSLQELVPLRYGEYMGKYIRAKGAEERGTWQCIGEDLQEMFSVEASGPAACETR